jgi:hypothetical protein
MKRRKQPEPDLMDLLPILLAETKAALAEYRGALFDRKTTPYNQEDETDD